MYKALVCCRAGMGTSMLLKKKADQVIASKNLPIVTEYGNTDFLMSFDGDLVITMADFEKDLKGKVPYVIGMNSIIDKKEMEDKLTTYLAWEENKAK